MDILAHAATGGLVALAMRTQRTSQPSLWCWLSAGIATALIPDVDGLLGLLGNPLWGISQHRGITHSIVFLPLYAWLLALLYQRLFRSCYRWQDFFPMTMAVLLSHVAVDLLTSYGTQLLSPFSSQRFSIPVLFIMDMVYNSIALAGLVIALLVRRNTVIIARLSLAALAVFILAAWDYQRQATAIVQGMFPEQPEAVHALPQPLSIKNWKFIRRSEKGFEISQIQLGRVAWPEIDDPTSLFQRLDALFQPLDSMLWQPYSRPHTDTFFDSAWREAMPPALKDFLQFAVIHFPDVQAPSRVLKMDCAWFADLRFMMDSLDAAFVFGACLHEGKKEWQVFQLHNKKARLLHSQSVGALGEAWIQRVRGVPELRDEEN